MLTSRIVSPRELVSSNLYINPSISSIFHIPSKHPQEIASKFSISQVLKFSISQILFKHSRHSSFNPLRIKDLCIQAIEWVYARTSIGFSTFKISLHTFKLLCCIFFHDLQRYISSTYIQQGFRFHFDFLSRVFEVESKLLHLHIWLHSKFKSIFIDLHYFMLDRSLLLASILFQSFQFKVNS